MPYNIVPHSFHTGVTAEALRAKIDRKSAISHQRGHFDPKFQVEGVAHHQSFLHTNMKSHTDFRLLPTSMTLNDLERRNRLCVAFFHGIRQIFRPIISQWLKIDL